MKQATASYRARLLGIAEISIDARALGEAALASDWNEVRFLALRVTEQALDLRAKAVVEAAHRLCLEVGPPGTLPGIGYGAALMTLADAIGALI